MLWRIETPPTPFHPAGTTQDRWWGAVVQDALPSTPSAPRTHILLYDAYNEFAEDTALVTFLPDAQLTDHARAADADASVLDWRLEEDARGEGEVELREFARQEAIADAAAGVQPDEDLRALSLLPVEVQRRVATGYRTFADGVKRRIGELVRDKGAGYVVTEADVLRVVDELRRREAAGGVGKV